MAEQAIKKLGTFLADLTQDKPPDQIHREILVRLRDPDQELDHRLAGIYLLVKDFVPIWTAIRNGVSLPASSWETLVLPVVVHFSPPNNLKSHLESVTSLFLTARGGREIEADPAPTPVYAPEPLSLLDSVFDDVEDEDAPRVRPTPVAVASRTGRRWVPQAAAVTIVVFAALALWTGGAGNGPGGISFSALRERPSVTLPSTEPSASPSPDPQVSASPTPGPGPTSTGPGPHPPAGPPARVPGAPTGLKNTAVDRSSVTLAWNPPADAANVAHYKVFQDGVAYRPTVNTTDRVIQLQPATAYTFVVRAYNSVGQESAPSNSLVVTTSSPMQTTFDVPSSVVFGSAFSIGGTGWPCAEVRIYIGGSVVEFGKVDEFGSFDTQVKIHDQDGESGWVDIIGSGGGHMQIVPGSWSLTASCPGGPSKSAAIAVIEVPMVEPSTASA